MAWHEIRHRARLVKSLADVPPVDANEARLGQVFLNLLVNAAQAIPEGHADEHEIRVATRTDERGNVVVEVSDTGIRHPAGGHAAHLRSVLHDQRRGRDRARPVDLPRHGPGPRRRHRGRARRGKARRSMSCCRRRSRGEAAVPSSSHDVRALTRRRVSRRRRRAAGRRGHRAGRSPTRATSTWSPRPGRRWRGLRQGKRYDVVLCDLMMPVMTGMDLYAEVVRTAPKLADASSS